MSAAIHTKWSRANRLIAWTKDGRADMRVSLPYPYELHHSQRHGHAAKALAEKLGWHGLWIIGHNENGSICAVQMPDSPSFDPSQMGSLLAGIEGEDWFFIGEPEQ